MISRRRPIDGSLLRYRLREQLMQGAMLRDRVRDHLVVLLILVIAIAMRAALTADVAYSHTNPAQVHAQSNVLWAEMEPPTASKHQSGDHRREWETEP